MAQAPLKKSNKPTNTKSKSSSSSHSGITKKGSRTIAPKNAKLAKQQKMTKKFSAGLINETERMLGAKAGHLEMLGGGKRKADGSSSGSSKKKGGTESTKGKGRAKG
jgi:Protein of unknown function (DUF2462)